MPMPKRKPQSMSAKGEETAVIVSIIAAVTEAAQILRAEGYEFSAQDAEWSAVAAMGKSTRRPGRALPRAVQVSCPRPSVRRALPMRRRV
ncbi:MAG: hypothetical protein ACLUEQ_03550 [Cloacibacillus evryensis]